MQKTTTRKKRPRQEDSPDSESEKRRGRPRVEKPDLSNEVDPKDRRRLQIRMAQRAYRQRKESTLDELRKRVSELSNTIELMNKAFGECRDRLYSSNLALDQMRDLQVLSAQFDGYLADARNPAEEDIVIPNVQAVETAPKITTTTTTETPAEVVGDATNVNEWLDTAAVAKAAKARTTRAMDIGMGYEIDRPESQSLVKPAPFPLLLPKSEDVVSYPQQSRPEIFGEFDMGNTDHFDASVLRMNQPSPPTTYSFQESTLARRLFRASLEGAYHILLDPSRRLVDYERIFKLSLMGRTRATILKSLRRVLSKGIDDELDAWHAPLIHIGGSGTHYPRRDARGNLLPKKQSTYIGLVGPQKLALLQEASRDSISVDLTVEIAGFEGEWFDPYDVQGYLEEKGIFIDPSQSFAEAELFDWSPSSTSSSSPSGSNQPLTPDRGPGSLGASTRLSSTQLQSFPLVSDASQWNELSNMEMGTTGFSNPQVGPWMAFDQGSKDFHGNAPLGAWNAGNMQAPGVETRVGVVVSPPTSRSVLVDVSKFIEVLVLSGVCLGRSPGFRRRDVDRALAIASFDPC